MIIVIYYVVKKKKKSFFFSFFFLLYELIIVFLVCKAIECLWDERVVGAGESTTSTFHGLHFC